MSNNLHTVVNSQLLQLIPGAELSPMQEWQGQCNAMRGVTATEVFVLVCSSNIVNSQWCEQRSSSSSLTIAWLDNARQVIQQRELNIALPATGDWAAKLMHSEPAAMSGKRTVPTMQIQSFGVFTDMLGFL